MLTRKNLKECFDGNLRKTFEDIPHLPLVVHGGNWPLKPSIALYFFLSRMQNLDDTYILYRGLSNRASISQWFSLSLPSISLSYLKFLIWTMQVIWQSDFESSANWIDLYLLCSRWSFKKRFCLILPSSVSNISGLILPDLMASRSLNFIILGNEHWASKLDHQAKEDMNTNFNG